MIVTRSSKIALAMIALGMTATAHGQARQCGPLDGSGDPVRSIYQSIAKDEVSPTKVPTTRPSEIDLSNAVWLQPRPNQIEVRPDTDLSYLIPNNSCDAFQPAPKLFAVAEGDSSDSSSVTSLDYAGMKVLESGCMLTFKIRPPTQDSKDSKTDQPLFQRNRIYNVFTLKNGELVSMGRFKTGDSDHVTTLVNSYGLGGAIPHAFWLPKDTRPLAEQHILTDSQKSSLLLSRIRMGNEREDETEMLAGGSLSLRDSSSLIRFQFNRPMDKILNKDDSIQVYSVKHSPAGELVMDRIAAPINVDSKLSNVLDLEIPSRADLGMERSDHAMEIIILVDPKEDSAASAGEHRAISYSARLFP